MTSKLSWIPFIPLTLAAVFFKLAQGMLAQGSVFGLSNLILDYIVIGCAVAVFLGALILTVMDRKVSQYYQPHRNIAAGVFGLILAVLCAADGANRIYLAISAGEGDTLNMIEAVLLLLTAVVFIVMGLTHSFVNRDTKHFSLFNVMPALLCAIRLVRCFISFTTISIRSADVLLLICYVFSTLFFFNLAVTISLTEAKHAVKSCFIFGFPAVTILLAYSLYSFTAKFDVHEIFSNAVMAELLVMALYILSFLVELTMFIKDRDHVVIKTGEEDDAPVDEQEEREADNYLVTGMDDENRFEPDTRYLMSDEFDGYLIRETENPENETPEEERVNQSDSTGYITEESDPHEGKTPYAAMMEEKAAAEKAAAGYDERLDEIDKLILELTEGYQD